MEETYCTQNKNMTVYISNNTSIKIIGLVFKNAPTEEILAASRKNILDFMDKYTTFNIYIDCMNINTTDMWSWMSKLHFLQELKTQLKGKVKRVGIASPPILAPLLSSVISFLQTDNTANIYNNPNEAWKYVTFAK